MGIYKDIHAFRLIEYIYRAGFQSKILKNRMINVYVNSKTIDLNDSLHENCYTILKPSTMIHIAHKLLHLAATNNTDGGHYNTRFRDRIIIAFCHQ